MAITTRVTRTTALPVELERVWEAICSPERLSRWLGVDVDLDVRPGGEGTARDPDGDVRRMVVEDMEPGRRLAFHWWPCQHPARTPAEAGASTVEIDLEPVEGGTLVRVTETAPPPTEPMTSATAPRLLAAALA
ncbi:MAG: SRPBCC family protein [Egibacteraceae bacterium]